MGETARDKKLNRKLRLTLTLFLSLFLLLAITSYMALNALKIKGTAYSNIAAGYKLIADTASPSFSLIEPYLLIEKMLTENDSGKIDEMMEQCSAFRQDYDDSYAYWKEDTVGGSRQEIISAQAQQAASEFFDLYEQEFIPAIKSGDRQKAVELAHGILGEKYSAQRIKIDELLHLLHEQNMQAEKKAEEQVRMVTAILLLLGISFLIITIHICCKIKFGLQTLSSLGRTLKGISPGRGESALQGMESDHKIEDRIGEIEKHFNQLIKKTTETREGINECVRDLGPTAANLTLLFQDISEQREQSDHKLKLNSVKLYNLKNDIGELSDSIGSTGGNINMIATAIEEMSGTTRNLAAASEQTAASVSLVSGLATGISKNIDALSESSRDVSALVSNAATAVKEINISLGEINSNCERSIYITADASEKANDTNAIISKLDNSSKQIEKIINVINDIADQTNMLALNAAIEAAGAGEAGKGFAVVANEVKELAKQTAEATEEIGQQIENMQFNMTGAVRAVATITEVVSEINVITNTIAAAVTEQSASTGEILNAVVRSSERVKQITNEIDEIADNSQNTARGIAEASEGVMEIARSATEISLASNEAAENIDKVSTMFQDAKKVSQDISRELTVISENLDEAGNIAVSIASNADAGSSYADILARSAQKLESLIKEFKVRG